MVLGNEKAALGESLAVAPFSLELFVVKGLKGLDCLACELRGLGVVEVRFGVARAGGVCWGSSDGLGSVNPSKRLNSESPNSGLSNSESAAALFP
jgi:hypothetical protein